MILLLSLYLACPDPTDAALARFPDPIADLSRFPTLGDVDALRDVMREDRDLCIHELAPPCQGGPLVDPACQPDWVAYWEMRRDVDVERLEVWQDLYDAEFAMWPDRIYPSTEFSLDVLNRHPVTAGEWDCWRKRARAAMGQLRRQIGEEAWAAGKMP